MRKPEYISPTQLALFAEDPSEYYLRYLSDNKPEREPQTRPMSVGSAFDAYTKAFLMKKLFPDKPDPRFEIETIFNDQVEPCNREWAKTAGDFCFQEYKRLGALDNLVLALGKSAGKPRFEMDVKGTIHSKTATIGGVPFNGKPDCFYISEEGAHVILDWKVTGYCSKSGASPMPGYVWIRQDGKFPAPYGDKVEIYKGVFVNTAAKFEALNLDWARQLCIYSWLCGEEVGEQFVAQIHQLVCRPGDKTPRIRIAEHSLFISKEFQERVYRDAEELWSLVNSDHFFRHMSKEDSLAKCKVLDARAAELKGEDFFSKASRS